MENNKNYKLNLCILCLAGIVLDAGLSRIVSVMKLPLYIDCIGSVYVAALAGMLPGMIVGAITSLINSIYSPVSIYHLSVRAFMSLFAAILSSKGLFKKFSGIVLLWLSLVLFGGIYGSIISWNLFSGIGGVGEPLALVFFEKGFPPFLAQLCADFLIDMLDKFFVVSAVSFGLKFYPKKLYGMFCFSYLYDRSDEEIATITAQRNARYRKKSIENKFVFAVVMISIAVGLFTSVLACYLTYKQNINDWIRIVRSNNFYSSAAVYDDYQFRESGIVIYFVKIFSIQVGVTMGIIAAARHFMEKYFVRPLNDLVDFTLDFDKSNKDQWLTNDSWKNRKPVRTGDEIETLYKITCQVQEHIVSNLAEIKTANQAKTEFLSRISHDIRTPLNGITGMIHILEDPSTDEKTCKMCYEKIRKASNHLLSLVNDVLDMSKLESDTMVYVQEPFDFDAVMSDCLLIVEESARNSDITINVSRDNFTHQCNFVGSPLHLRQIILNILTNGIKYNRTGGSLDIRLSSRKVSVDTVNIEMVFADTGIGMTDEYMRKIFDPFSREDSSVRTEYYGTGLGLSIVKKIVDDLGGTISVQSVKGEGSTFRITLPFRISTLCASPVSAEPAVRERNLQGRNILIVEDNELNAEVVMYMLKDTEANIDWSRNGQDAVEKFISMGPNYYSAIFMDVQMPVMNGIEAAKKIRECGTADAISIPIIAMTANAFHDDVVSCKEAGMNEHIAKPLSIKKLLSVFYKYCN